MKISKTNSGVVIGTMFTLGSILLTATIIVPIISVLPGIIFETIAGKIVNNEPYSNVGKLTIKLLSVIFLLALILCLLSIVNKIEKSGEISHGHIIGIMSILYFFIHSLGFYIYWGVALDFASDGQLMFGALISYPISSLTFVLIGILIDKIKNRCMSKYYVNHYQ